MNPRNLAEVATNIIKIAAIYLPADVKQALEKACQMETNATGRSQLDAILKNIELADRQQAPICQDTGTITFYIKAGSRLKNLDKVESALKEAVSEATERVPLRPNAVNPFTQKNSFNNIGRYTPAVHMEIVPGNNMELTVMLKGGGSENVTALGMLNPSEGMKGLMRFVVDAVVRAGAQPCPPTVLGVAVGGSADMAISLAKKALLRKLNEPNPDANLAELEHSLLNAANSTGIGPMGLGGDVTVLAVHVDYAFRHPASFPVAVVFSCWCDRRASARINGEGRVEYLVNDKWVGDFS